jgi:hypothetical protein
VIEPKNKNNSAFTKLPQELLETITAVFDENFEEQAKIGKFIAFGQVHQNEMVLRIGYVEDGSIGQINFDTSNVASGSEAQIIASLEEMVFATKELFLDYFKNKNLESFSYHWNPLTASEKAGQVYYKLDSTNTSLEKEANALLGENFDSDETDGLIVGDMSDSEEIEKIVETLESTNFTFK